MAPKVEVPMKYKSGMTDMSKPRVCAQCGKKYWRRDLFQIWAPSLQNGSPMYHKVQVKLCVPCVRSKTQRLLNLVNPE